MTTGADASPDQLPLVLVHAFPMDARLFDPLRDRLPGIRLLTPDLPGFGDRTGDLPATAPSLTPFSDAVLAVLDAVGAPRAVIGGVSLGGYVALDVLRRAPERVAGLVLVDTRADADDDAARERRHQVAARADRGEVAAGPDAVAPLVHPDLSDGERDRLAGIAAAVPPVTVAWTQRAMAARPDSTEVLAGAGRPVLVLVGERDEVTPVPLAEAMADAARRSTGDVELVTVAGAGHLSPAEAPDQVAAALVDWWPRVR
ncbi:alpha/beta fold hydrolase [Nakamurella leprariae]|uniref:Alpha/beta hydrolase n=1 Tax=Nakamurella leprariae TaxID=2803911 RepID=A0A939BYP9_9ACTN|nr:alpha/beta hydrolase [Nakamurella leprariae]MBM9466856.1 alpha/beta hydrolase [Nakamurella leprariae]